MDMPMQRLQFLVDFISNHVAAIIEVKERATCYLLTVSNFLNFSLLYK